MQGRNTMTVFWRELLANRRSLIGWMIGMAVLVMAGMTKYGAFKGSPESLKGFLEQIPPVMRTILGLGTLDISTVMGFYGVLFVYIILMSAIHAITFGASIISKEERDRTSEFLYVKPVTRAMVVSQKLLAAVVGVAAMNITIFISSVLIVRYYDGGSAHADVLLKTSAAVLCVQLIFLTIGMAVASISRRPKHAPALATTIVLVTFLLGIAIQLYAALDTLTILTPFRYFDGPQIILTNTLPWGWVGVSLIVCLFCITGTYRWYAARDLAV